MGEVAFTPDARRAAPARRHGRAAAGRRRRARSASASSFEDVTRYAALQSELEGNRHDLELAYEELQSTIDELETTNEELQSANEELQTTNEELQSTNEELETMNEELQSTNEELETINDELRDRTAELNRGQRVPRGDPHARSASPSRSSTAHSACRSGTARAEDLWGVRPDEAVEHHFLCLDIGLPSERLAAPLRAGDRRRERRGARELEAVNRRGRRDRVRRHVLPAASAARRRRRGVRRDRADGGRRSAPTAIGDGRRAPTGTGDGRAGRGDDVAAAR